MRRLLAGAGVVLATVATTLAFAAGPASAHFADISCTVGSDGETYEWVSCTHPGPDSHQYRAWIKCTNGATHTGNWDLVNSGLQSQAFCSTNTFKIDGGFDISPPS